MPGLSILITCCLVICGTFNITYTAMDTVDVTFTTTHDGSDQKYILMRPDSFAVADTHDLVVALHGHGSDRWQFATDTRGECKGVRDVANERNMIYVSPDYRGCCSWMGPRAEEDVVQIISDLRMQFSIRRVFMCGASMGGTSTLIFAARFPELLDGIASMNGTANMVEYDNFQSAISSSYGGSKTEVPDEYYNRSAEYFPRNFTMPVGLAVGGNDAVVPPYSVLRLADTLQAHGRQVLMRYRSAGGHTTPYADARAILEFAIDSAGTATHTAGPAPPAAIQPGISVTRTGTGIIFFAPGYSGPVHAVLYRTDGSTLAAVSGTGQVVWHRGPSAGPGLLIYTITCRDHAIPGKLVLSR